MLFNVINAMSSSHQLLLMHLFTIGVSVMIINNLIGLKLIGRLQCLDASGGGGCRPGLGASERLGSLYFNNSGTCLK